MSAMASKITSLTIVYSTVYSGAVQRKHQSSASLAFVRGIHRWPVNSPHNSPVTRKMIDYVIMTLYTPFLHQMIWTYYVQNCFRIYIIIFVFLINFQHQYGIDSRDLFSPTELHVPAWGPTNFHTQIYQLGCGRLKIDEEMTESL